MDFLSGIVQTVLTYCYDLTVSMGFANYGVAIIVMTVLIKMLLYPLTVKQIRSMKAMSELQPKMKALQEKYKDDKVKLQSEISNLYKVSGVNPLSGCLPLVVQMPILIAIFYAIRDYQYAGSTTFLWLASLADPDPTYVLPVISAATTFVQSLQTMPDTSSAQNKMMLYFMPVFIGYISLQFSAGLVLYWIVTNLVQILQQWWMARATKA